MAATCRGDFAECRTRTLGKNSNYAECLPLDTRQSAGPGWRHVAALPSVRALGKAFAECQGKVNIAVGSFAECLLPSVTLGKDFAEWNLSFAEWNLSFAECNGHSAKFGSPVVKVTVYV